MTDIMKIWNESASNINISLDQLRTLIEKTIPLIGHEALLNDQPIILEWAYLEKYIYSKIEQTDPLHDFLNTHIIVTLYQHIRNIQHRNNRTLLFFDAPQHARAYNQFLHHILPIKNPDFPILNENKLVLSSDQFHFINRLSMLKADNLPAEFFKDCYLKTLRSDQFDFTSTFLITLFNTSEENRALQNLRPVNRGCYIIYPGGRLVHRHEREPTNGDRINGFTQIQSVTFIDDWLLSPAFGHSHRETLYGLVTHHNDLRISRLLKKDSGTIGRPFETNSPFTAGHELGLLYEKDRSQFSEEQLSEFKRAVVSERSIDFKTNEVLARMRFNPHKSFVAICSNTLSSRLLAYDFAQELLESFEQSVANSGLSLNPNFKLPLVFYNKPPEKKKSFFDKFSEPNKQHELSLYTSVMRQRDIQHCHRIFNDPIKRRDHYYQHDFDFLLGLHKLTLDIFLESIDGVPLALFMLKSGYARVLLRLLKPSRLKKQRFTHPELLHIIFKNLLDRNLIQKNDFVIAELIRIEAFELAKTLIQATNSEIKDIKFRTVKLVDYLVERGNPRQIMFLGLKELLKKAAEKKCWVTIRLCLKEIKNIDTILLGKLFLEACKQSQHSEIILLIKLGAANDDLINQGIRLAAIKKPIDTTTLKLFLKLHPNHENYPELGRALLLALRRSDFELARDLFKVVKKQNWRNQESGKLKLQSTLLYVIKHPIQDLLEASYQHETSYHDEYSETRLRLALDLAKALQYKDAIDLLEDKVGPDPVIDPRDPIKSVCILVFEAYILGEKELAEWRLFHYGREINIIPSDGDTKFTYGFKILLTAFERALPFLPFNSSEAAHKLAATLLTFYKDSDLYQSVRGLINSRLMPADLDTERAIASKIIDSLNPTGSHHPIFLKPLKRVISQSNYLHIWLSLLINKLTRAISDNYVNTLCKYPDDYTTPQIEEYFELGIFILDLIINNHITNLDDELGLFLEVKLGFHNLFLLSYRIRHDKTVHTILTNPFIIKRIFDDLLNVMIENIISYKLNNSDVTDTDYFCQLLEKYPFKVKHTHIEYALTQNHPWQLIPLLKSIDDEDIQNPDNFWQYFELWRKFKLSMIYRPKDQSDALASKLGPTRTRHYTLLNITLLFYKLFENQISLWSYVHLKKLPDSERTRKIIKDFRLENIGFYHNLWPILDSVLSILDDYLSNFSMLETFPNEQTLLNTYKTLLSTFESAVSRSHSPTFFDTKSEQNLISEFHKILSETDQIFNQTPSNNIPESKIEPDPSDIVLYM